MTWLWERTNNKQQTKIYWILVKDGVDDPSISCDTKQKVMDIMGFTDIKYIKPGKYQVLGQNNTYIYKENVYALEG